MRKALDIARRAFHPRPAAIVALVLVSAVGLVWCFLLGGEGTPASYVFYALSAYALAVVVVAAVPFFAAARDRALANRHVARMADDEALRVGISAAWSIVFDLAYAGFAFAAGFALDSDWAVAVALYHVAIVGINLTFVLGFLRGRGRQGAQGTQGTQGEPGEQGREQAERELRMVRACGILLAVLAITLAGVMAQMVLYRQAWVYDEVTVIAIATFTFVNLGTSIHSVVRVRAVDRPSVAASRAISFSKTLVQLFFLETTMIAVFGGSDDETFRFTMEAVTGAVVLLLVLGIALALIVFSARKLRD